MSDLFGPSPTIKAISLWQPWGSLIARGLKLHETRHWSTSHRGRIAIHAAKTRDLAGSPDELCRVGLGLRWAEDLPLGAVVAVARLVACRYAEHIEGDLTRADRAAGNYAIGRFAWRLEDVRPLAEPIPAVGRQGLFNWTPPDDLDARLLPPVDHEAACAAIGWGRRPMAAIPA